MPKAPKGRPSRIPRSKLGQRIVTARKEAGLTQSELASKLDVTQRVIAYWERESVSLKADQLNLLASALDVSVDHLLGRPSRKISKGGPVGRVRKVFEAVSKLPRNQQNKVAEFVEAFVNQHANGKG